MVFRHPLREYTVCYRCKACADELDWTWKQAGWIREDLEKR